MGGVAKELGRRHPLLYNLHNLLSTHPPTHLPELQSCKAELLLAAKNASAAEGWGGVVEERRRQERGGEPPHPTPESRGEERRATSRPRSTHTGRQGEKRGGGWKGEWSAGLGERAAEKRAPLPLDASLLEARGRQVPARPPARLPACLPARGVRG